MRHRNHQYVDRACLMVVIVAHFSSTYFVGFICLQLNRITEHHTILLPSKHIHDLQST